MKSMKMNKLLLLGLLMPLLAPLSVRAQSPFDGTWKINMNTVELPKKPVVFLLQNGMWHCQACVPPSNIKADGKDYKTGSDDPCLQTLSIEVIDARTIDLTHKNKGKITDTIKAVVSPDGSTLTFERSGTCNAKAETVTAREEYMRAAKGPVGTHAISGSWRMTKVSTSDDAISWTWKLAGDTLTENDATGESFAAKLDGTYTPEKGDPSHSLVSVKRESKNTLVETTKVEGKVVYVTRMTLAPDGKTVNIVSTDRRDGTTVRGVAEKQ